MLKKVENVQWRVDVALSTSSAQSVLRPSVLMRLKLTDGSSQLLDLDLDSFSQLRCRVAELLAELQAVQEQLHARTLPQIRQMDS